MLVKEFIQKYPNDSFHMMTPGGFLFLTPQQAKELLAGKSIAAHPGDLEFAMTVDADEILSEPVENARWENHICYMMTGYPQEEKQKATPKEVTGTMQHEKEQKLKERLKGNYETYIQQIKTKSAPDLIEMASEIAATKFVYEELMSDGYFSDSTDYLMQFENPLEMLRDNWISEQNCDHHEELDHMLWNMADKGIGADDYPMTEEAPAGPSLGQGVTMC